MIRATASALLLAVALGGCGRNRGVYPSLAPRPIEKLGFEEPDAPAPAPAPVAADPKLDVEVAAATARVDKAAGDFARAAERAETLAGRARGVAAGGEPWIEAQTALAELDTLRAETSEVLTDLEQLAVARAATLAPDYPALVTAQERARRELDAQATRIARIGAGLAPA